MKISNGTNAQGQPINVKLVVFDIQTKQFLPGVISQNPNAIDISPTGQWLAILPHGTVPGDLVNINRLYKISDLAAGDISKPVYVDSCYYNSVRSIGHNGWAYDKNGDEVLVYQDNRDDWMKAFNPDTGQSYIIFKGGTHTTTYDGQHIAAIKNPGSNGWFLMSTYGGSGWTKNQLLMFEVKSLTYTEDANNCTGMGGPNPVYVPQSDYPRVWRIGASENRYTGSYDTEGFASINMLNNKIYVGANWNSTDNLEVYRIELPQNWWTALG